MTDQQEKEQIKMSNMSLGKIGIPVSDTTSSAPT
jgi:hypothetical protein